MTFFDPLALRIPIIQAPMAGVSTPSLAAAVSNAGALGSIGVGATNASGAAKMIDEPNGPVRAPLARSLPAAKLVEALEREMATIAASQ